MNNEDARYKILRILESTPEISQRELAEKLGVSLGKVNYCLQALVAKGLVISRNFSQSNNKGRYLYLLTPSGIERKARMAREFLNRKISEYEILRKEIEQIQRDLDEREIADNRGSDKF